MDRKVEAIILAGIIGIMVIIGVSALVLNEAGHEDEHEDEHDDHDEDEHDEHDEHEHEDGGPMEEFVHHVSNWMIWVIFGAALAVGIILFMYIKKKEA